MHHCIRQKLTVVGVGIKVPPKVKVSPNVSSCAERPDNIRRHPCSIFSLVQPYSNRALIRDLFCNSVGSAHMVGLFRSWNVLGLSTLSALKPE